MREIVAEDERALNTVSDNLNTTILENVTLWPLAPGSKSSHPKYRISPEFAHHFEHLVMRHGRRFNTATYEDPGESREISVVAGTSLYGGVIFSVFGHFLSDSIHRLWPIYVDPALSDASVVFHTWKRRGSLPAWANQVFHLLKIDLDRIVLIDSPVRFEKLVVPVQGSLLRFGPINPRYRSLFPPRSTEDLPVAVPAKRIYVSRSKFTFGGSYLGETLVERILEEDAGFEILHPQQHPIAEVLGKLQACETAIFAEGSAIHLLELCRRAPPNVFVISRRPTAKDNFRNLLSGVAKKVGFSPITASLFPLDWKRGGPSSNMRSAVVDIESLVEKLGSFCGVRLRKPLDSEIREAQALSLLQVIIDPRATHKGTTPEQLGTLLVELRHQVSKLDILPWSVQSTRAPLEKRRHGRGAAEKNPRRTRAVRASSRNPARKGGRRKLARRKKVAALDGAAH